MLRLEDCKPGVQVICINSSSMGQHTMYTSWIKTGAIYTIKKVYPNYTFRGPEIAHGISLEEIELTENSLMRLSELNLPTELPVGTIERFKLIDPRALDVFRECVKNIDPALFEHERELEDV